MYRAAAAAASAGALVSTIVAHQQSSCAQDVVSKREAMALLVRAAQEQICSALADVGGATIVERELTSPGDARTSIQSWILEDSDVYERAGVHVAFEHGTLPQEAAKQMRAQAGLDGEGPIPFYICGINVAVHPHNPQVPTVYANYHYVELDDGNKTVGWFSGGSDLAPAYLYEDDAIHFHSVLKSTVDKFGSELYSSFKADCDERIVTRTPDGQSSERRGVGGIFFHGIIGQDGAAEDDAALLMISDLLGPDGFLKSYLPLVERRAESASTEQQKRWQQLRRKRWMRLDPSKTVDLPGTLFKETTSRVLPPLPAGFDEELELKVGPQETKLALVLREPVDWIALGERKKAKAAKPLKDISMLDILAELATRTKRERAARDAGGATRE
jgi:coproporphyrinogen III oxidase